MSQPTVRSLTTTDHEIIHRWAEERGALPATVPGTECDARLCVLRFDFPGCGSGRWRRRATPRCSTLSLIHI